MISLGTWLVADPNITDLFQREHPQILAGIAVGLENGLTENMGVENVAPDDTDEKRGSEKRGT